MFLFTGGQHDERGSHAAATYRSRGRLAYHVLPASKQASSGGAPLGQGNPCTEGAVLRM